MSELIRQVLGKRKERPEAKFSVARFFTDGKLLGPHFADTWIVHLIILKVAFGEPITDDERATFDRLAGRDVPSKMVAQLWLIAGRGSGKSKMTAGVAVYLATAFEWRAILAAGELGVIMVMASDRAQAKIIFRYVEGMIDSTPLLAALVIHRTTESIEFSTGAIVEIHTASFRSIRGRSLIAVLCDEIAFWRSDESANPDTEIIRAALPGLARIPGSILICISSPYRRSGELWKASQKYEGKNSDKVLVVRAATMDLNSTIDREIIDDAIAEDPEAGRSEWCAEFRTDISSFLSEEEIGGAVREEGILPPRQYVHYRAAVDMSGGRRDRFALAIGHQDGDTIIVDGAWHWAARTSVESVVREMASILNEYRCAGVVGDRYGSELTRSIFRAKKLSFTWNERTTSDIYLEVRVLFSTGRIQIPNNTLLLNELRGLERRPGASGKDKVDHAPSAHDDLAAATAMCVFACWKGQPIDFSAFQVFECPPPSLETLCDRAPKWDGSLT